MATLESKDSRLGVGARPIHDGRLDERWHHRDYTCEIVAVRRLDRDNIPDKDISRILRVRRWHAKTCDDESGRGKERFGHGSTHLKRI